jgi:hypothetical protein
MQIVEPGKVPPPTWAILCDQDPIGWYLEHDGSPFSVRRVTIGNSRNNKNITSVTRRKKMNFCFAEYSAPYCKEEYQHGNMHGRSEQSRSYPKTSLSNINVQVK